ncbi:hypothetical protein L6R50_10480 [Myxococcota bacterium]|nr:hypothetical protein [Myxococcota bacterium]
MARNTVHTAIAAALFALPAAAGTASPAAAGRPSFLELGWTSLHDGSVTVDLGGAPLQLAGHDDLLGGLPDAAATRTGLDPALPTLGRLGGRSRSGRPDHATPPDPGHPPRAARRGAGAWPPPSTATGRRPVTMGP